MRNYTFNDKQSQVAKSMQAVPLTASTEPRIYCPAGPRRAVAPLGLRRRPRPRESFHKKVKGTGFPRTRLQSPLTCRGTPSADPAWSAAPATEPSGRTVPAGARGASEGRAQRRAGAREHVGCQSAHSGRLGRSHLLDDVGRLLLDGAQHRHRLHRLGRGHGHLGGGGGFRVAVGLRARPGTLAGGAAAKRR